MSARNDVCLARNASKRQGNHCMVEVADLYVRRFKMLGGWLCLDFLNTNARYLISGPDERFRSYGFVVSWAWQSGLMTESEAQELVQEATSRQAEADAILERTIALRETLYRIFTSLARGRQAEADDLAFFNRTLAEVMTHARIERTEHGFAWGWTGADGALDAFLWPVVRSAADLLVADELRRLRLCDGDRCGFMFLDKSKNQNRRWCEPELCGNRARVRNHYHRSRRR